MRSRNVRDRHSSGTGITLFSTLTFDLIDFHASCLMFHAFFSQSHFYFTSALIDDYSHGALHLNSRWTLYAGTQKSVSARMLADLSQLQIS